MYIAVLSVIVGQALLIGKPAILVYARCSGNRCDFVAVYEEPALTEQFGDEYREYKRAVPAWIPRPGRAPLDD